MKQLVCGAIATVLLGFVDALAQASDEPRYEQITIQDDRLVQGIDIKSYTLITNKPDKDRRDAVEIMRVKADWPRAMQTKDKAVFESILAQNFTFRAENEWYVRDAYIRNRVERQERVLAVRYENLVLQFFREMAVLSYRNVVSHTNATGKPETLRMSWVDIFVRENGKWKIGGSHLISMQVQPGH